MQSAIHLLNKHSHQTLPSPLLHKRTRGERKRQREERQRRLRIRRRGQGESESETERREWIRNEGGGGNRYGEENGRYENLRSWSGWLGWWMMVRLLGFGREEMGSLLVAAVLFVCGRKAAESRGEREFDFFKSPPRPLSLPKAA